MSCDGEKWDRLLLQPSAGCLTIPRGSPLVCAAAGCALLAEQQSVGLPQYAICTLTYHRQRMSHVLIVRLLSMITGKLLQHTLMRKRLLQITTFHRFPPGNRD